MAVSMKSLAADPGQPGVKKTDLFRVDPRLLDEEDGFNLRDYSDPEVVAHIEGFAESYAAGRYVPPLVVRVAGDGRIVPVEGHCRRRGALLAIERGVDLAFVDCVNFRGNDAERVEVMLRSAEGLKLKPLAVALGYLRLSRMGHSNVQIAEAMHKTPARVEQMLLLATANHDVQEMVRQGRVTADVAIEAIREHRDDAGAVLAGKLVEAQASGKGKVTRGVLRGPALPRKLVSGVVGSVTSLVTSLDQSTRRQLAELESLSPDQLSGKTVSVDASALLALLKAQASVAEVEAKHAERVAAAETAAKQGELLREGGFDDLLCAAVGGLIDIEAVQRVRGIGFSQAADLLSQMEAVGLVSAMDEDGRRRVIEGEQA